MPSLSIDGTSLEYSVQGRGEPVVLIHGSASDYRTWSSQQDELAKQFRVVSFSRRYHWPNKPIANGADYSMAEHVDDLQQLIQLLDLAPAHLVGHSYGAFVALLLAIREPRLVRTLVLAEPPVITLFTSSSPKPPELLRLLLGRPRTAAAVIKFGATGFGPATAAAKRDDMEEVMRLSGTATLGAEAYRRLSKPRLEQVRANLIKAEFLGSGLAPLNDGELRGIQAPALLVNGQRSPALFHRLTDRLQDLLPHAEKTEIAGASHIMHEDNAPAYNAVVLSFLMRDRAG